jgi:hypothetical protein
MVLRHLQVIGQRLTRYTWRKNKNIILYSLLNELYDSYHDNIAKTIDRRRIQRIIRYISRSIKNRYTWYTRQKIIHRHLDLITDEENKKCPYIMFMLNVVHIAFLYKITNPKRVNETNIKDSVDNLVAIYSGKITAEGIDYKTLQEIAQIIINCNLIHYRTQSTTINEDLDQLLLREDIQAIPVLHILLNSVKITLAHNRLSTR